MVVVVLLCSCVNDEMPEQEARMVKHTISLTMPYDVQDPKPSNVRAELTNIQTKKTYEATHFKMSGGMLTDEISLPEGLYNVKVDGNLTYKMEIVDPVSYTHLTLPTNREV